MKQMMAAVIAVACGLGALTSVAQDAYKPQAATAEGLYREGSRLKKEGKPEAALTAWRTLTEKFPKHSRAGCAAVYMGQTQLGMKDVKGAIESFTLAADRFGGHRYGNGVEVGGYAYFYLTSTYCETKDYDKAVAALKALVDKYPYASGHRMGDALMSLRAKRWFHDKLTEQGKNLGFLDELIAQQKNPASFERLNARQLYLIAHTLKDEGNAKGAIEAFKKTVWKFPNESFTPYACLFAFELQMEQKDYDGAAKSAETMSKKPFSDAKVGKGGPLGAIAGFSTGRVYFERQAYKAAAKAFQAVVNGHPAAADMEGVSLRARIADRYEKTLAAKGHAIEGLRE